MALISNQDWKSAQIGQVVVLTDEERRTLIAEGYPIPQRFPLSKAEERSLKKIRRKIKNKISAQESRRKKKEYMEELEKKVHLMEVKIVELERENRSFKESLMSVNETKAGNSLQQVTVESSCVGSSITNSQMSDSPVVDRSLVGQLSSPDQTIAPYSYATQINEQSVQPQNITTFGENDLSIKVKLEQVEIDPSKIENLRGNVGELMETDNIVGNSGKHHHNQMVDYSNPLQQLTSGNNFTNTNQMQPTQSVALSSSSSSSSSSTTMTTAMTTTSIDVVSSDQPHQRQTFARRKDSTTSVINGQQQQTSTDDDYFIDDILMSQERQEEQQLATDEDEVDLVANLVGVVCEPDDITAVDIAGANIDA